MTFTFGEHIDVLFSLLGLKIGLHKTGRNPEKVPQKQSIQIMHYNPSLQKMLPSPSATALKSHIYYTCQEHENQCCLGPTTSNLVWFKAAMLNLTRILTV